MLTFHITLNFVILLINPSLKRFEFNVILFLLKSVISNRTLIIINKVYSILIAVVLFALSESQTRKFIKNATELSW